MEDRSVKTCLCYSLQHDSSLSFYSFAGQCRVCPPDCLCTQRGCQKCEQTSYREVSRGECPCKSPFVEDSIGSYCLCLEPYYLDSNKNCTCLNELLPDKVVYDSFNKICYSCPEGCSCNSSGCHTCADSTHQIVFYRQDGFWDCSKCKEGSREAKGYCVCLWEDNTKYFCKVPYSYPDQNGNCVECPPGCNCTEYGCISCENYTNR